MMSRSSRVGGILARAYKSLAAEASQLPACGAGRFLQTSGAAASLGFASEKTTTGARASAILRAPVATLASRHFTGARGFASACEEDLLGSLKSELEYEKANSATNELVPPTGWKLTDNPDAGGLVLRRTFGNEDIAVTYLATAEAYNDEPGDEADLVESDTSSPVDFSVTISKNPNGDRLTLYCQAQDGNYMITDVSLAPAIEQKNVDPVSDVGLYEGPDFGILDQELQMKFHDYLTERGINQSLATFITQSAPEKEQIEYQRWLERTLKFISSK